MLLRFIRLSLFLFFLLSAAFSAVSNVVSPSAKIQNSHRSMLRNRQLTQSAENDQLTYLPLILKLKDSTASLPPDVIELHRRGDLVLAYIPQERLDEIAEAGYFTHMEGREAGQPTMDKARTFTGLDRVWGTDASTMNLSGNGVVVGFTDAGFDPDNIEFIDSRDGSLRVKQLSHYPDDPQQRVVLTSPEEISEWQTDNEDMFHATHVAGILAGGYRGNDFFGIASGADIAASTSSLYDALMLAGMEDVIEYARQEGKPAVINMSISSGIGPHDGSSLFSQYLERMAQDAVICISAGNDGMRNGRFTATFSEGHSAAIALIDYPKMLSSFASGIVDVWSEDATPLNFAVLIVDRTTGGLVKRLEMPEITASAPSVYGEFIDEFAEYMEGNVVMASEINPLNNRFNATFLIDLYNHRFSEEGPLSTRYYAALEVMGPDGTSIEAYGNDYLYFNAVNGYLGKTMVNGTINDFITGNGVIGVGALTSRSTWPLIDGSTASSRYQEGKIADFSAFRSGTPATQPLPDIVAPGAHVISAVSTHYMDAHPSEGGLSECKGIDGTTYCWKADCGTSMSSPYVAGVCALMLEVNPDLTPAEVKEIIISTAEKPTIDGGSPRWGRGILNSHAAIKEAASRANLPLIPNPDATFDLNEHIEVYNLAGQLIKRLPYDECPTLQLPPGLYIVRQGSKVMKVSSGGMVSNFGE